MRNKNKFNILLIICIYLIICVYPASAIDNPATYLKEEVTYYYNTNGTVAYNVSAEGYIDVEVSNTIDVLQYILLNISDNEISNTNVLSKTVYAPVAASPTTGDLTRLFFNTDNNPLDITYKITNSSIIPIIQLKINYFNTKGGSDLYPDDTNIFIFNLSLNSTKTLENVSLTLKIPIDYYGTNDSLNIYNQSTITGNLNLYDYDNDSFYDTLNWTGTLKEDVPISIIFYTNITPNINFDENLYVLDLVCASCVETISYGPTFTNITVQKHFSRGPIQSGIDIIFIENTLVRGFIKNIANGLDYIVNGWRLYNVTDIETPLLESSDAVILNPGELTQTGWYQTNKSTEKYFSAAFDWEILWGSPNYYGITRSFIDMPVLYEADISLSKSSTHKLTENIVSVIKTTTYMGHENLEIASIYINSTIPHKSVEGFVHSWTSLDKNDIYVYHINSTGNKTLLNITTDIITIVMPTASSNGYVYLNIDNLSNFSITNLKLNEDIMLTYNISTNPNSGQNTFLFNSNITTKTISGTPLTLYDNETVILYGAIITAPVEGGSAGGGGGAAAGSPAIDFDTIIELVKEDVGVSFIDTNTIDITGTYRLIDLNAMNKGLNKINVLLDIPQKVILFDESDIRITRYDSTQGIWIPIDKTTIKKIEDNSLNKTLYYINLNPNYVTEPILKDNDLLKVDYGLTLPFGSYDLMIRAIMQNPYTNETQHTNINIPVRIIEEIDELKPLEINESEFKVDNIIVGIPLIWTKTLEIYNPNKFTISDLIETQLLQDFLNIDITEEGKEVLYSIKKYDEITAEWKLVIKEFETQKYTITITTAPVIRIKENTTVLENVDNSLKLLTEISLKNPSLIDYNNVKFVYPQILNIINIVDSNGNQLEYITNNKDMTITIPNIKNNSIEQINIIYNDVPGIFQINLENLTYETDLDYKILYVPQDDEKTITISVEVLSFKDGEKLNTVYADIIKIENITSQKEINIYDNLLFKPILSGTYTIFAKVYSKTKLIGSDYETFTVEKKTIADTYKMGFGILIILTGLVTLRIIIKTYNLKNN
ncbi:MAG: hypothetical protein K0B02_04060 [DPANN group archaeon]|nr:hypothetical protein [DPANN group archaeon]